MKKLVTTLSVSLGFWASSGATDMLLPLESTKQDPLICGCSFSEIPANPPCVYTAPDLLILDVNGNPPHARVNIGKGNLLLRAVSPIVFPLYHCTVGDSWVSEWLSDVVGIRTELRAMHAGAESCWFKGTVRATFAGHTESVAIEGACGC